MKSKISLMVLLSSGLGLGSGSDGEGEALPSVIAEPGRALALTARPS